MERKQTFLAHKYVLHHDIFHYDDCTTKDFLRNFMQSRRISNSSTNIDCLRLTSE
jgi:hypothetical protein